MDFKNKIKDKYNSEVTPVFGEERWDAFLRHKAQREKRPGFWLLYFFGFVLLLFGLFIFLNREGNLKSNLAVGRTNIELEKQKEDNLQNLTDQPEQFADASSTSITEKLIDLGTEKPQKETGDIAIVNSRSRSSWPSEKNDFIELVGQDHSSAQRLEEIKLAENKPDAPNQGIHFNPKDVVSTSPGTVAQEGIALLPVTSKYLSYLRLFEADINRIEINRDKKLLWQTPGNMLQFYGGISFPLNVETVEEQAHQFGAKFYHNLNRRLRTKAGFEFALISFRSFTINPALGVHYVESPSDVATFNNAIVESVNLSWDVGLDALVFSQKNWKGYFGISYQVAAELDKEIEYNFNGDDDNDDTDDIHLAVKDIKKYFVPHILKIETGLQYETPIGGLNISIGYPHQLSKTRVELLNQIQVNLGYTRNF